jgi:hypothetical protein
MKSIVYDSSLPEPCSPSLNSTDTPGEVEVYDKGRPISSSRPLKPLRLANSLLLQTMLLARFNPWCDESDVVDTGLVTEVNHLSDLAEVQVLVALDEHHLLLTG